MVLGKLLVAFEWYICEEHGHHVWRHIRRDIADEPLEAFCPYDDKLLYALVEKACLHIGHTQRKLLDEFGYSFIKWAILQGYSGQLHYLGSNLPELLTNLNNLHLHLSHMYGGMRPPNFKCTNVTPNTLELHYWSSRKGLWPIVPGILRALSKEVFGMTVNVTRTHGPDMEGSDHSDHDTFRVEYPYQPELHNWENAEAVERARVSLPADSFFTLFPFHIALDEHCRVLQVGSSIQRMVPAIGAGAAAKDFLQLVHPYVPLELSKIQEHLDNCFVIRVTDNGLELKGQMVLLYHDKETGETSTKPFVMRASDDILEGRASCPPSATSLLGSTSGRLHPSSPQSMTGPASPPPSIRPSVARRRSLVGFASSLLSGTGRSESASSMVRAGLPPILLFLGSPRLTSVGDLRKYQLHLSDVPLHDINRDYVLLSEQRTQDMRLKDVHGKMFQELLTANERLEAANERIACLEAQLRQLSATGSQGPYVQDL